MMVLLEIRDRIYDLNRLIDRSETYIERLQSKRTYSQSKVEKQQKLLKQWRIERYELQKELVVLEAAL